MRTSIGLFLFILFFQMAVVRASETEGLLGVTGRVSDSEGNALAGAVISVENTLLGTSTALDGTFTITFSRIGQYKLSASFIGYRKQSQEVTVDGMVRIDFILSQETILGEAAIVSATRASSRMPIAQTSISSEDLERSKTGFDIPFLLETIPSVVAVSEGGTGIGNTAFRIRGSDMTRINITVNGIPINDPESQGVWWVNMPDFSNSVDNVQIQRGVGTSTHGAGAFGATVNFQTTTLNPEPFAWGEITAGSFNTFRTSVKAGTGILNERFSFEGRYSRVTSDGYIDRGWSDHNSLFFTGAWHTERSILRFNLIHGEQHTGITWEGNPSWMVDSIRTYNPAGYMGVDEDGNSLYYPNESDNYAQTHYQAIYSFQLNQSLSLNLTGFFTKGEGFYEQYKVNHRFSRYGLDPLVVGDQVFNRSDLVRQKWLDNSLFGATYSVNYSKGKLSSIFGGGVNSFDNDHFGKILWTKVNYNLAKDFEWYRNNGSKKDYNVFAKSTLQVMGKLSLFGDVQYRIISYNLSGNDDDLMLLDQEHRWSFINPKGGAFYTISSSQSVFFSVGMAHREPTRADIKDAMKGFESFTPRAERLVDYELGLKHKSQAFAFETVLYWMDYHDQLVLTGKISDVGYPLMSNVAKSYRAGIELITGIIPTSWLRWDANLTLSRNRIKEYVDYVLLYNNDTEWIPIDSQPQRIVNLGETSISFSPEIVGSSQLRVKPLKDMEVSFITKYVGSQYVDNTRSDDRMLDAYLVNNIKIDYKLHLQGTRGIGFQLIVNNIFNEKYSSNGYIYDRAAFANGANDYQDLRLFPQAGINFMSRIVLEF